MDKSPRKIIKVILPLLFVFVASLYRPIDPDLGWHLKYGEYFFENLRPLRENIYSTQMQDFHWANISWGIDVVTYTLYSLGGFFGLTVGSALVVAFTFFIFSKAFKVGYWERVFIYPTLFLLLRPIIATSFRGQNLSLLFFGVLIFILSRYKENRGKIIFLLPLLFLLWANLHGLFVLGLGVLILWQGFFLVSLFLEKRELEDIIPYIKRFFVVNFFSVLATLFHPFGLGVYYDAFLHFNNPLLKSVSEYLPPELSSPNWLRLYFTAILAGVGFGAYMLGGKLRENLSKLGIFTVLFVLSLWVKRYSWAMYYMFIPLISPIVSFIKPKKEKNVFRYASFFFAFYIIVAILIKFPFSQLTNMNWNVYCDEFNNCSPEAAEALSEYYVEGKTMMLYNWGGWLIWNYPEMKPSVDGRMHLWRDESGFSAFEYDYNIEQNLTDVNNSKYDVVFTGNFKPIYDRLKELDEEGRWELVYEDETSAIFVRN